MLVTLTTDFGADAPYVAAMKGVLLSGCEHLQLVDLGHDLPPQNVTHAAYFLAQAVPFFPVRTIHVCVVDPGVGTERALLLAEAGGQFLLAPDNGLLTFALTALGGATVVRRLNESKFWRPNPSRTFQGRDILAPVAAQLAMGTPAVEFGPTIDKWIRLEEPVVKRTSAGIEGAVVLVDSFGNLITNIPARMLPDQPVTVQIGDHAAIPLVQTYGDALPGTLVALSGSSGHLEIAVVNGNAAQALQKGVGALVCVRPV